MDSLFDLDPDAWTRLRAQFAALLDLSPEERTPQLERLATTDPALHSAVEALLRAATGDSPLDAGLSSLAADILDPDQGDVPREPFGPYRLVRRIGRGGMGVVYLAHRDDLDANAAIKILPHAWVDPGRRAQFGDEMRILAALAHPSIARLLNADLLEDGTPWFAMEYVDGVPITDYVRTQALPVRAVLALFDQLCAAVAYAHSYLVIHRDIKPSNVLVTTDGLVKLVDFGIAKRRDAVLEDAAEHTRTAARAATTAYAAPEQLLGRVTTTRTDVYALGVLLCELLTGRRLYDVAGLTAVDVERAIRTTYPASVRRALAGTMAIGGALSTTARRDVEALVGRAVAPDAGDRYASVEAFRADLQRFLRNEPLQARPAGWRYRAHKFLRRRAREVATGVVAVAATVTGVVLHTRSLTAARDLAQAEVLRTDRLRQYLQDLFDGGPGSAGPPDSMRVATLLANGVREARMLTAEPAIQIDQLTTLGSVSERLGNFVQADSLFRLAVERSSAFYGAYDPQTLYARMRRARVVGWRGQPDSAIRELRLLSSLARTKGVDTTLRVVAEINSALGVLLYEHGQVDSAITYLRAAEVAERGRDSTSRESIRTLLDLAAGFGTTSQYGIADSLFRRALALARRQYTSRNPEVASILSSLGSLASERGRLDEAERYERESRAITVEWYGATNPATAIADALLAQNLIRQRKYDDAIPLVTEAIDAFAHSPDYGPHHPMTAISHNTLGLALAGRGDHAAATREFEHAFTDVRAAAGDRSRNSITIGSRLGVEYVRVGRAAAGISLLRQQLATAAAAFGETNVLTAQTRARLGEALAIARRYPEAIAVTTASLPVLDSVLGRNAPAAREGREQLVLAYLATGDSVRAARVRAELADTAPSGISKR